MIDPVKAAAWVMIIIMLLMFDDGLIDLARRLLNWLWGKP